IFIALCEVFDLCLHLVRRSSQVLVTHQLGQDQAQTYATLGFVLEQLWREWYIFYVHAALSHVLAGHFSQALGVLCDQRLWNFQFGGLHQGFHHGFFVASFYTASNFAFQVDLDVFAHFGDVAVSHAQGLGEFSVDFRQVRPFQVLQGDGERSGLAGDVFAMVILWERQREGLGLAHFQADGGGFEFWQHAAFAQYERVAFSFAARELNAVDRADEVHGDAVAVGSDRFAAV